MRLPLCIFEAPWGAVDMTKFNRIVHRVAELGWQLDVYFEARTVGEFASTLRALPTSYVIDYMGTILLQSASMTLLSRHCQIFKRQRRSAG